MMIKLHLIDQFDFYQKISYKLCLSLLLSIVAKVVLRFLVGVSSLEKCLFDVPVEEEEI